MASNAGKDAKLYVSDTYDADPVSNYSEVGGNPSFSFSKSANHIDNTGLADGDFEKILQALKTLTGTIECYTDFADTAQDALRDSWDDDQQVYIAFLPDGTNGYHFAARVLNYDESADVSGESRTSFSIKMNPDGSLAGITDVGTP